MIRYSERGLSLVELMIALALSSLLILGVTQVYLNNRTNYLFHQGQSENIQNGRFALLMLEQQLAKTGYRRSPDDTFEFAFPAETKQNCAFDTGQTIYRVDDSTLCLRYQPQDDQENFDCAGNTVTFTSSIDEPYNSA